MIGLALVVSLAQGQVVCDQPRPRDTSPLLKAIQDDDAMASTFDVTAGACTDISAACDAQKLKCGDQLTTTLQRQVNVDNGMWLRDMLLPFLSQRYTMTANIASTEVAQDVSCNQDSASLKAAATRRRQLAMRRRDIVNEYPKWAMWAAGIAQRCKADAAVAAKQAAEAEATAKAQAAAAAASRTAEEIRQDNIKKAQQAEKDRLEAEKKKKEDAARAAAEAEQKRKDDAAAELKRQQEAQAEMIRRQKEAEEERLRKEREAKMTEAERQAEAKRRAEAEAKRKAEEAEAKRLAEEERKKREAQALADARFVQDRESKKTAAEKKADELRAAEEQRRISEEQRRAIADKQIAGVEQIDRSDERLAGSLAAHAQGGYGSFTSTNSGVLLGLAVQARYGLWMTAPAQGMASGMELRATAQFLSLMAGTPGVGMQYFSIAPELRWFVARFGFGATFEYRRLVTPLDSSDPQDAFTLGLNVALAIVDSPAGRFIIGLRYLPLFLNSANIAQPERFTAEVEFGYKVFSGGVQFGTVAVRNGANSTLGWYVGLGLGGRLRF